MNTVEHIVECYFHICRRCFTMHDVKVVGGNNRQFDLVAVSLVSGHQYHVESAVTHCEVWCPDTEALFAEFDRKFFGTPARNENPNSDFSKGRNYFSAIQQMYRALGLDPEQVTRVYCTWIRPTDAFLDERVAEFCAQKGVAPIQVLSFRDEVLPSLEQAVATANYEDEALRTLSLLRQRTVQTEKLQSK